MAIYASARKWRLATHLFHTLILASGCVRRSSCRTGSAGWYTGGNPPGVTMAGGSYCLSASSFLFLPRLGERATAVGLRSRGSLDSWLRWSFTSSLMREHLPSIVCIMVIECYIMLADLRGATLLKRWGICSGPTADPCHPRIIHLMKNPLPCIVKTTS